MHISVSKASLEIKTPCFHVERLIGCKQERHATPSFSIIGPARIAQVNTKHADLLRVLEKKYNIIYTI
jgi:hypothetical protein